MYSKWVNREKLVAFWSYTYSWKYNILLSFRIQRLRALQSCCLWDLTGKVTISSVLIVLNRYRQRKRAELDSLEEQLHGLEGRNRELRDKAESVEREIQYVKDLLIEVYKARSQRLKQETSAWPKARPPDDGPASRIVSSLIGNGDLSWNVFWLNVLFLGCGGGCTIARYSIISFSLQTDKVHQQLQYRHPRSQK